LRGHRTTQHLLIHVTVAQCLQINYLLACAGLLIESKRKELQRKARARKAKQQIIDEGSHEPETSKGQVSGEMKKKN
jgi:hypothetical protein